MNRIQSYTHTLTLLIALLVCPMASHAFEPEFHAEQSVLAEGNWVKISVSQSGIHFISAADLRRMGFSNPSAVRVHGYGAERLPDILERDTYIDDLPELQTVNTDRGIYFYATGPVQATESVQNQYTIAINPFTTLGYYFLTESSTPLRPIETGPQVSAPIADSYTEMVYNKRELVNTGETGHVLLGEDFVAQPTQKFTFNLPDRVADSKVWLECSFYANCKNSSRIVFSVNDNALTYSSSDNIGTPADHYVHAIQSLSRKSFDLDGDRAVVSITHSRTGSVNLARLNYLVLNYQRKLQLSSGRADFRLTDRGGSLAGAQSSTRVWDVTDPCDIKAPATTLKDERLEWQPVASGTRHYIAWNEGASYPAPVMVERVTNQNLHGQPVPDMVIFSHPDWISQAERVADLHRNSIDSLRVLVVNCNQVYNEFASGAPDANALRKLLKMFWDRSATSTDGRLQYALIMGRSVYDNRRLTPTIAALNYKTLPGWQTDNSLTDNSSYTTDDIYAMLSDRAGRAMASDYQCIAVGRMPVISLSDARAVVDKLYAYVNNPINTEWKNRALMIADDENQGLFMSHTDSMIDAAAKTTGGSRILWDKIYIDAYEKQNSTYPGARSDMFRTLTEGVVWWNFAGHANPTSWTGDGLMTYADINNLYLKHFPFVTAATCDFVRWDGNSISAAEILYRTPSSGIIGSVSATRPAYIDQNGILMANMGKYMFATDANGRNLTIGEIFRRTKNNSSANGTWYNENKLRYVLMGDPAMRLCVPNNLVRLTSINGIEPDIDLQPTIMAAQDVIFEGCITAPDGTTLTDFNGKLFITLYDAEYSTTSHGYGENGKKHTFEQHGKRLQAKVDSVSGGLFSARVVVPGEIADNFRPGTLNMYAVADDGRDAIGISNDFYIYGYDENAATDTIPPVIESFYLNHSSFKPFDMVNTDPVVIAEISDNRSINLSSAGIGHQMLLTIDGRSLTDTPLYYTPFSDGRDGGTLVYQLDDLEPGAHTLRLRIWDTSGNSSSRTIDFNVGTDIAPRLYDIYADANPASTRTNLYVTHDRPDALMTVNIEVFNLLGRRVWSSTVSGMSDTLRSFPVTWNLTDEAVRRVGRGIYLYRASITTNDGATSQTETRRIAVTAQ
ncbi:MAG: type IX secretion system sortase PorU [Muribaculaceae bacterium]|nr:type IX secretion system sortase PorU [Muribaculaceae bacterium]